MDGAQERYLSDYGIRRSKHDGATLEADYIRDIVPLKPRVSSNSALRSGRDGKRWMTGNALHVDGGENVVG